MASRIGTTAVVALLALGVAGCSKSEDRTAEKTASSPADAGHISAEKKVAEVKLCEHEVPADQCTQCNPELGDAFKDLGDWCDEHGLPESHCRQCDPDLKFSVVAPKDWCKEHAVPESQCTKCNPKLVAKFIEANDYCREHEYPASVCPVCRPEKVKEAGGEPPVFPKPGTTVRLASAETARDVGIQTQEVVRREYSRRLEVVGQLQFDQNRHAQLSARAEALVFEAKVDIGDEVKAGQALVVLASSSVGSEQARLSVGKARIDTARAALEREQGLAQRGISPLKDVQEARNELAAALGEYDAARSALGAVGASPGGTGGRYVLSAPFAGTVVARDAVAGKTVAPGQMLVEVADLATMWAQLDIPESDASLVRPGQQVQITFEGLRGETRHGNLARVGTSVDAQSRTVPARVELPNPDRTLTAGVFIRASIQVAAEHEALLVPREAIQRAENRTFVFVKKKEGIYEPVAVELGAADRDAVEVVKGLSPGAQVVTTGAFLLKTEILKGSIGAGCCDEGE